MNPLVSIVIPMYNAEQYIHETLDSVKGQTYSNWECIVIDDGSTDESLHIVLNYCKQDSRYRFCKQKNSGPSVARNLGFNQSKGLYIQYLDADDVILPQRLEIMIKKAFCAEKNRVYYSDLLVGEHDNIFITSRLKLPASLGRDISFNDMYRYFAKDFIFIPSCVFFPRTVLEMVSWNDRLNHSEDWDFYLQILSNNYVLKHIPTPLVIYRNSPNSLSKDVNRVIKANYGILYKWVNFHNSFSFSLRISQLFQKSIMFNYLDRSKKIIWPRFTNDRKTLILYPFIAIVYPLTIVLLCVALFTALLGKIKPTLRK